MSDQVSWIIELAVKPGQLETFKALRDEMIDGTGLESGAVGYEWSISADETTVHIHETYADSDAALAHMSNFATNWAARFMGAIDVTRMTVYGNPNAAARAALDRRGVVYQGPWGGFSR